MSKVWNPQCITRKDKGFGTSAKGFLTPCCWVDFSFYKDLEDIEAKDPKLSILFKDSLKVSNNESIEDILLSNEWLEFHDNLILGVEYAPRVCKKNCYTSSKYITKKTF
jgi:hypothetical protein